MKGFSFFFVISRVQKGYISDADLEYREFLLNFKIIIGILLYMLAS